jgi:hypothetical protein
MGRIESVSSLQERFGGQDAARLSRSWAGPARLCVTRFSLVDRDLLVPRTFEVVPAPGYARRVRGIGFLTVYGPIASRTAEPTNAHDATQLEATGEARSWNH